MTNDLTEAAADLTEAATGRDVQTKKWRFHFTRRVRASRSCSCMAAEPAPPAGRTSAPNSARRHSIHRVLVVDMPGWGQSDTATPDDRDHLGALELFLDALDLGRVALIGNSMGGMTALRFAAAHPERVSHLICMGSPAPGVNVFAPGGGPARDSRC